MSDIPSTLDTAKFRHLVVEALYSGSGGSIVSLASNGSVVNSGNPLPVVQGFTIPAYNDVEFEYQNGAFPTQPTYITFKQNGTPVYYIYLQYDGNGALTRVAQD